MRTVALHNASSLTVIEVARRFAKLIVVFVAGQASCSGGQASTVDLTSCPPHGGFERSKVRHQDYLETKPNDIHRVFVGLQPPRCKDGRCESSEETDGATPDNDEALTRRGSLNQASVNCVLTSLARDGKVPEVGAAWYEKPRLLSSGRPVPIGLGFGVSLSLAAIDDLASDPLVSSIAPMVGAAAGIPVANDDSGFFDACPTAIEASDSKLLGAVSIKARGRQPVVVVYRDSVLPPPETCNPDLSCANAINREWTRTILNTREVTCVRRWIDTKLQVPPGRYDYGGGTGSPTPLLPPFGQAPSTVISQGMTLSWDEAVLVASHPFVESIWAPADVGGTPMPEGCPPDLSSPLLTPTCTEVRESFEGKISATDKTHFETATGGIDVLVMVGGVPWCVHWIAHWNRALIPRRSLSDGGKKIWRVRRAFEP